MPERDVRHPPLRFSVKLLCTHALACAMLNRLSLAGRELSPPCGINCIRAGKTACATPRSPGEMQPHMKNLTTPCLFARAAGLMAALLVLVTTASAQHFTGYDEIVPAGAPGTLTILDGTGKVLPSNRSYVIGIEGGTRGCIEFRNWTGTAAYPIAVVNRHATGRVIITDFTGSDTPTFDGIKLVHCRYVQVRGDNDPAYRYGIEIAKVGKEFVGRIGLNITGRSSYVEAMFLEIHHSEFAGIMAKQDPLCSTGNEWSWHPTLVYNDIKLHDNYVHDVGGEGFYIGYTAWASAQCSGLAWGHEIHGLKVYNNLVERGGWDGIQVGSARTGTEIYNNMIVDSGVVISTHAGNTGVGVQLGAGTSGLFYNNTIINSRGNNISLFGVGDNYLFNNLMIGGNNVMFSDNRPNPVPSNQPADRQTLADAPYYFFNNTVVDPGGHGLWTMNEVSANYFKNNIIVVPNTTSDYIRYENTTPTPNGEIGNVMQRDYTGLGFVNPAVYDFRIAGTSSARDFGNTLPEVTRDFQGISRPQGTAYDAGFAEAGPLSVYLVVSPPAVGSNNGSITASAIGGTAPYTYAWAHGPTTTTISNLSPGLYSVIVTDAVGAEMTQATYLFAGAEMGMPVSVPLPNQVVAPTMNPASGTYSTTQAVALSTPTSGASIRYTTDGSTPTPASGIIYSDPISVSATGTIKAIAYKSSMLDSTVTVATYFIGSAPAAPSGVTADGSDRRVALEWNASAGANRYDVSVATVGGGPYTTVAVVTTNAFTHYNLTNGTTYHYIVTASNIYGASASSAEVSATPVAYPGTVQIITPVAFGPTTAGGVAADGTFNEQPIWNSSTQLPEGISASPHTGTGTSTANRFWYIDFGSDYAQVHIVETWTRYRPFSGGTYFGFPTFWWDDDIDATNDGVAEAGINFATAQNLPHTGAQLWSRDRDFGSSPVTPLNRYLIVATGSEPSYRPNEFAFVGYSNAAPTITAQPQSQNAVVGSNVTFTVSAIGSPAPTYQWRKDSVTIPGATSASYTINGVQTSDAGGYSVVVSNASGSATSDTATLSVVAIGIVTPIAWGTASGSAYCAATGAFNEQPTWNSSTQMPDGISATPHASTTTAYANRHWYIDLGVDYADVRITEMWTRYRPNSGGSFAGFAAMWWDDDNDTTNDGVTAAGLNFATAQNHPNTSAQLWVRDADFNAAPVTPQGRYLVVSTGATVTDRPNEFAFVGYR